jgi:hypothetical protein
MPDFSACPLVGEEAVDKWLQFYTVPAPFTVLSVFVSRSHMHVRHVFYFNGTVCHENLSSWFSDKKRPNSPTNSTLKQFLIWLGIRRDI